MIEMVNLYIDTDRKADAVTALTDAIALDPENASKNFAIANIYIIAPLSHSVKSVNNLTTSLL